MLFSRTIITAVLLLSAFFLGAQKPAQVRQQLQKRYGEAIPWGEGFIVKTKSLYGFANRSGRIVLPVYYTRFDTLLPDRASVGFERGAQLMDARGELIGPFAGGPYRLVNRELRVFAAAADQGVEMLYNDRGEALFHETYDALLGRDKMLETVRYDGGINWHGVRDLRGRRVIPERYEAVSTGWELCSGFRNDTAFVFNRDGRLLFSFAQVHGCRILANDMIVLRKYWLEALVSKKGETLTGYQYGEFKSLYYEDSLATRGRVNSWEPRAPVPNYALTGDGQQNGLVNDRGEEIIPATCNEIKMNSRGWVITEKPHYAELLDQDRQLVMRARKAQMRFFNQRYVWVWENSYSEEGRTRSFDMVKRQFADTLLQFPRSEEIDYAGSEDHPYYLLQRSVPQPDSILINTAYSCLRKKNGRWGVLSVTGDTILPFLYDTAGKHGYEQQYFVGNKGQLALLDLEGQLAMPVGLPELPWKIVDSLAYISNHSVYSFKGWQLKRVDQERGGMLSPHLQFVWGVVSTDERYSLKSGLYNRQMKRLGDPGTSQQVAGRIIVRDTSRKMMAVIDTSGKEILRWMKEPGAFHLQTSYALVVNDSGKADVLYRFKAGKVVKEKIWLDAGRKKIMLSDKNPNDAWRVYQPPVGFEKRGYGKGVLLWQAAVLIKGSEAIKPGKEGSGLLQVRKKGKWGLYDAAEKELLAPQYDSVVGKTDHHYLLFNGGKAGIFEYRRGLIIQPVYDSILFQDMYFHFFVGYRDGKAEVVNDRGKVISRGWETFGSPSTLFYNAPLGLSASKQGVGYLLFPSGGDSLMAVKDEWLPAGSKLLNEISAGLVIVAIDSLEGVFDTGKRSWLIPPLYHGLGWNEGFFVAQQDHHGSKKTELNIFDAGGQLILSNQEGFTYAMPVNGKQFMLECSDSPRSKVVDCHNRTIVPDTFETIESLWLPRRPLYKVKTKQTENWLLIDTLGRMFKTKGLEDIYSEYTWERYATAWKDGLTGLLPQDNQLVVRCEFNQISPCESGFPFVDEPNKKLIVEPVKADLDDFPYQSNSHMPPIEFFVVTQGTPDKFGLVDGDGNQLIPCIYDSIYPVLHGGHVIVKKGKKWGLVDFKNKLVKDFVYPTVESYVYRRRVYWGM